MRDMHGRPFEDFTLPEAMPEAAKEPYASYCELVTQLRETREALAGADAAVEEARKDDIRELAEALRAGAKDAKLTSKREAAARDAASEQRTKVEALEEAVDLAGDAILDALEPELEAWRSQVTADLASVEAEYRQAIQSARDAVERLSETRLMADWISRFNPHKMRTGNEPQEGARRVMNWAGNFATSVKAPTPESIGHTNIEIVPAVDLLDTLARVVDGTDPASVYARAAL